MECFWSAFSGMKTLVPDVYMCIKQFLVVSIRPQYSHIVLG